MTIGIARKKAKGKEYYSVNENNKPPHKQVYHDNDQCRSGREILTKDRRPGNPNGYRRCEDCDT
jgi:hypothetical protein